MSRFLLLIPVLLSLGLLAAGREYVFDDTAFLLMNPDVARIQSFWDCFHFSLQPTKPIANFFLALGLYLGKGSVLGQKSLSLILHLATAGVLHALLRRVWIHEPRGKQNALAATLVFCILPIHTETLGVAQFRGEILATLALVTALWLIEAKQNQTAALLMVLGLQAMAFMSKEVLGIVFTLVLVARLRNKEARVWLGACAVAWTALLLELFHRDKLAFFSYRGTIGTDALTVAEHASLALRALLEGGVKVVSGLGLSSVRLRDRWDVAHLIPLWGKALALAGLALFSLLRLRARGPEAFWIGFAWVAALAYVVVPNVNMGSEHYWYCASVAIAVLLVLLSQRAGRIAPVALTAYTLLLCLLFAGRAQDFVTRIAFYRADWERHPEAASTWLNMASALSEKGSPPAETLALVERARAINPREPSLPATEFSILVHAKKATALKPLLQQMEGEGKVGNRALSQFYLQYSSVLLQNGDCWAARTAVQDSLRFDGTNPAIQRMLSSLPCQG